MARLQFVANDRLIDKLKALMIIENIKMGEQIRRCITNWFALRRHIHQGKQIMIHDPQTGESTVYDPS